MQRTQDGVAEQLKAAIQQAVADGTIPRKQLEMVLEKIRNTKIHILLVGATGAGKSSTINALFATEKAVVGTGVNPETIEIAQYHLDNVVLWDSPGLGDSPEKDQQHIRKIREKLQETDVNREPLIDLVLLIVDGSSRDMGATFSLLEVILPELHNKTDRLLIGINQADLAMKGQGWDSENHRPGPELEKLLEDKVASIRNRIAEVAPVVIEPIYYSAGFKGKDGSDDFSPYNLEKLLALLMTHVKAKKRIAFVEDINRDRENFRYNDGQKNYEEEIATEAAKSWIDNLLDSTSGLLGEVKKIVGDVLASPQIRQAAIELVLKLMKAR
ncbi:GTPase family protein [Parapusillimonas granuli]|uniref:50S ribosome-binding GTPase n=1 Tax=Parapusillimonas granuli TaxID=380911 RepID=A0A853GB84_9BURK|nr:GTPase [Parapusillimonas granuli]MBB5213336.1 hypothetical protein [Parapusillimonas granuli]NYT51831.1 50S ribosome-binding GTPase [Parapusillimonas granuli]